MAVSSVWGPAARRAASVAISGLWWCIAAVPAHAALTGPSVPTVTTVSDASRVTVSAEAQKPRKTKKAKKAKQVTQPDRMPSGETVSDRERRLMRECKGRPNAGACLGFAS